MSNTTRYDALLTLQLAHELNAALAGRSCRQAVFDRERSQFILSAGNVSLRWDLRSGIPTVGAADYSTADALLIPKRAAIGEITALPDERIVRIALSGGERQGAARFIMVELLPAGRNAIALDSARRVLKLLLRGTSSRPLLRGKPYAPPPSRQRRGLAGLTLADWLSTFTAGPAAWPEQFIEQIAYASPLNADALFAGVTIEEAYDRYQELLRQSEGGFLVEAQPYPHHLWQLNAVRFDNLLGAFAALGGGAVDAAVRLEHALQRQRKKLVRLHAQLGEAGQEATQLRADADLLMAHAHALQRGASSVQLIGFDGQPRALELDPKLSAVDNAQAWYEHARKRERAAVSLPHLIAQAEAELRQTEDLLARVRAGEAVELPAAPARAERGAGSPALPYKRFRTRGGLEVRVGRSRSANDALTFKHSAPNDVWLHAREVGGAHVVLRWPQAEDNPPRADLIDAAMLAALHSKARHSGTVPVDYTRRKYVRKPRGAPAGQVRIERAQTLFVEPDPALLESLAD